MIIKTNFLIIPLFLLLSKYSIAQNYTLEDANKNFIFLMKSNLLDPIVQSDSNLSFNKAKEAFNNNDFTKAINIYNTILELNPEESIALFNRGLCYYKINDVIHCCADFHFSAYLDNPNALINYISFCDSEVDTISLKESGFLSPVDYTSVADSKNLFDTWPHYPGGKDSLLVFLINSLGSDYFRSNSCFTPERILVKFTIDENGLVSEPAVINVKSNFSFQKEINQIFSGMSRWEPASKNGIAVKCKYIIPAIFNNAFIRKADKYNSEGLSLYHEGKLNEAIVNFNKALFINENDYDALFNRGICLVKNNDTPNACIDWGKSYLILENQNIKNLIYKYCDSTIQYNGKNMQIDSLENSGMKNKIFTIVDEMPVFPGGEENLFKSFSKINYPRDARENGITGSVYVSFVIDSKGKVINTKVKKGIGGGCDEEALRIVNLMPDWIPGKQNGVNVNVQYILPIRFDIENKQKKDSKK